MNLVQVEIPQHPVDLHGIVTRGTKELSSTLREFRRAGLLLKSGKPVFATVDESGGIPAADLTGGQNSSQPPAAGEDPGLSVPQPNQSPKIGGSSQDPREGKFVMTRCLNTEGLKRFFCGRYFGQPQRVFGKRSVSAEQPSKVPQQNAKGQQNSRQG